MNRALIERWNKTVKKNDTVYILGDIAFRNNRPEYVREILGQLNGKKVVVRGNHDSKKLCSEGLDDPDGLIKVSEIEEIDDNGRRVIMCHYPMFSWNGRNRNAYMLHGHVHMLTQEAIELERYEQEQYNNGNLMRLFNVGCMFPYMDYAPRTLSEIKAGVTKIREEKFNEHMETTQHEKTIILECK